MVTVSAAPAAPAATGASTLGDLSDALERLRITAGELFTAYEDDVLVYNLAVIAGGIVEQAQNLECALNGIGGALQNIGQ